jgi:UDP-N-acetylmuramoyl-tripeptide--D-alanyl-D-alanine ligase
LTPTTFWPRPAPAALWPPWPSAACRPPGCRALKCPTACRPWAHLAAGVACAVQPALIAVTGSNGKTTVTQMIAAILQAHAQDAAFATRGNLNNAIGVPQTLLRLNAAHRVGVVELGMNHPGEIALLARIAQPTVALVNNAQREHLEFMHTVQAVAEENGSVLAALPEDGVAVFPAGDAYTALWQHLAAGRRCITFGGAQADVRCTQAQWQGGAWQVILATPQGPLDCALHIAGRHNVTNAQAAAACALAAGVPLDAIARGLSAFAPVKGRSRALGVRAAAHRHRGGRQLQRQPRLHARRHRGAGRTARAAPAGAGRHGRGGRPGAAVPRRGRGHARARGIERLYALGTLSRHTAQAFGTAHAF